MAEEQVRSEIVEFYRDKTIFITGGTGFIGRVLVEHLLRKCHVKKIYMLVRAKKGVLSKDRKLATFDVPLFETLKSLKPDFLDSIEFINGDVSMENLGIDDDARQILLNDVQIAFHTAATVKLRDHLKTAASINVKGTLEMCTLCSKMTKLEVLVHVSTAFSNATQKKVDELIYDVPLSAENLLNITQSLSLEKVDEITESLIKGWPNTYSFSKAVAENVLKSFSNQIPICLVRPGLVINAKDDPLPGWVDNIYGPIGFVVGSGSGVLRVSPTDGNAKAEFVPVDIAVSCLLAAGRKTGQLGRTANIQVYNHVTFLDNAVNYSTFNKVVSDVGRKHPPSFTVWYYSHTCIKHLYLFYLAAFFNHLIPATLIDGCLMIIGKKPRVRKIYDKIHSFLLSVSFVSMRSWNFGTDNLKKLRDELNPVDKKMFNFDMSKENIDWTNVLETAAWGACYFLLKDDLYKNGPKNKRRHFWLYILHLCVQAIFILLVFLFCYGLFNVTQKSFNFLYAAGQYHLCNTLE